MKTKLCATCKGRGYTARNHEGRTRCWECNGNGLDPAEYFSWTRTRAERLAEDGYDTHEEVRGER